ncbi:nicotinate-nucleotide adenylyltransferase [Enterococcus cecorum]|uniref:Probable nicotinate-nucleotide adenylyltransferase n=1 Tax=Enterococcus cecorum DSM 20682 = ATCC 43198 TaxID=1121864 RepID=S1R679_9ENTE|nr:nicotinate-nucleotide adenylyltransferase [Enterococcus cecorum]EOX18324.1 nicotinate (nicotinamide) nucleotide adenylyltransferase [Enterococcus cecorum DSM 20682 = ATCC 43198]ESK61736.1 nicotinate (nicotinamide) nucleotide adenylyltransferase [Enterococcus cecorum DSM 20682 = ATCC 43198]CAI3252644.1 nicotinate-nucleotide adenylyltransferase [Enterococcus cecorum]CAI3290369.1 nicotinate-nucleotide adenylyltransferase [Enterococcus cecorum]CAI3301344.1 nicotinate-nucleotide adenylyltransfer
MKAKFITEVEPLIQVQTTQSRKQVGILGGNFNPVHNQHLLIADQVGTALNLEKVYLMPEYLPPHVDEKDTIEAEHRLNMLKLAIADNSLFDIEQAELQRKGKSYTYDTMKALIAQNPDTDYYFIIGGDMVEYLPKWYKIDELVEMVQFVGVKRPGYTIDTPYPIIWLDAPMMDLSSSLIRKKIAQGCSIRYLVPEAVRNYILEKGLYFES